MSKICSKCGIEKPDSEFKKDSKSKDGLYFRCKECDREYRRKYYAENRERIRKQYNDRYKNDESYREKVHQQNKTSYQTHKVKRNQHEKDYRNELQKVVDSLKTPCSKCGETRLWLIQFHHINPKEKHFQIQATHSKEKLEEEAKKCICLCNNCHAEYHFFFGKSPTNPKESLEYYLSEDFTYDTI